MLTRPKLTLSITNWPMVLVNGASCRVCNDYKDAGPLLRDLHILRKEWQTSPKRFPRRPSGGDQCRLGVAPLAEVLRGSTLREFLTRAQETSLSPSVSSLMSALYRPMWNAESNNGRDFGSLPFSYWAKTATSASGRVVTVNPFDTEWSCFDALWK